MTSADVAPDELEQLRQRVAELEGELKARDAFLMAAAHELRNPISPLTLHLQRLAGAVRRAEAGEGTVAASWLGEQVEMFARRLARFLSALNRILDVSSIQNGRIQLMREQVDLAEVTRDVVAGLERELQASHSSLTLEAEQEVSGHWDRMRLEQIVSNLITNAIRYGDSKPITVRVRAVGATPGSHAELTVMDGGIGIAAVDQTRIFERFERAHTQFRSGFGVGLWMVRQLCEAMQGSVSVESTPGEGSTFRVTLPATCHGSDG